MTLEQKAEIMRLAHVLATKRVRRFAAAQTWYGGAETVRGTTEGAARAKRELEEFLDQFITKENP